MVHEFGRDARILQRLANLRGVLGVDLLRRRSLPRRGGLAGRKAGAERQRERSGRNGRREGTR
jgi:hypothetical protein